MKDEIKKTFTAFLNALGAETVEMLMRGERIVVVDDGASTKVLVIQLVGKDTGPQPGWPKGRPSPPPTTKTAQRLYEEHMERMRRLQHEEEARRLYGQKTLAEQFIKGDFK